ncbi:MAG: phosphopantothenoylcysteine decarboxylase, partial [Lachnospiraceae bacterium]|nr:phosphopantothenoylcysteine decarboxylase [Lachnospiraceae bacterium]
KRPNQFLCGFCMETEKLLERAEEKRRKKNADLKVANNLRDEGAGFGTDTNVVTIFSEEGKVSLPKMSKEEVAHEILNRLK